jgi:hypothetical protein
MSFSNLYAHTLALWCKATPPAWLRPIGSGGCILSSEVYRRVQPPDPMGSGSGGEMRAQLRRGRWVRALTFKAYILAHLAEQ